MTRRRQFGTVRKLTSGRWQVRYNGSDGRRAAAVKTFRTKAEAGRWLAMAEADQARGSWVDPSAGSVTLADYAWGWLETNVRIGRRTREIYEIQLRLHILPEVDANLPALGGVALRDVTPELVRAWYAVLLKQRGRSTAAKSYVRLRQVLGRAVSDDRILRNPCRIEGGGVERHPEQRFASLEQLYALADAVEDPYRSLILLAGLAGLRAGEIAGLRRMDIDLLHAVVNVRRKRLRLSSGDVIEDHPKSAAGRRTVALPITLVTELDRHLAQHVGASTDAYVFTSSLGQPLDASNFRDRVWRPATRAVGLGGLRFHDLRHTAGTLAAQTGATTKELMARLGHASPAAAMVYQHATADRDRLIADGLTAMTVEAGLADVVPLRPSETVGDRHVPLRKGTRRARTR